MKQNYFEDSLKNILEEGEEQPYEQGQWRRLDRRLREADRPATPLWLRWLPVAFLLLLGAFAWQYFTLSRQLDALHASLITEEQTVENRQVRTTVVYDTVYLRTTVQALAEQAVNGVANPSFPRVYYPTVADRTGAFTFPSFFPHTDNLDRSFREYRQRRSYAEAAADLEKADNTPLMGAPMLPRESLALLPVNAPAFPTSIAPASSPYTYPKPSLFTRLKPKSYALDAGIGGLKETTFLKSGNGWMAGAGLHLGFGKRVGLRLGADYLSRSFVIGENDADVFVIPTAEPRSEDDELEGIFGAPHQLQLPVGLRINLLKFGKFSTFAEGGPVATLAFPNELRYNFEEENSDVEYDVFVDAGLPTSLRINAWYGRVGLQYNWQQRWAIQLAATRQQSFGDFTYAYEPLDFLHYRLSGSWRW